MSIKEILSFIHLIPRTYYCMNVFPNTIITYTGGWLPDGFTASLILPLLPNSKFKLKIITEICPSKNTTLDVCYFIPSPQVFAYAFYIWIFFCYYVFCLLTILVLNIWCRVFTGHQKFHHTMWNSEFSENPNCRSVYDVKTLQCHEPDQVPLISMIQWYTVSLWYLCSLFYLAFNIGISLGYWFCRYWR